MEKKKFVGRAKHLYEKGSFWDYCLVNIETKGQFGFKALEQAAVPVAHEFGKNFRQNITYQVPENDDVTEYYQLKLSEKKHFENAVEKYLKILQEGVK